MSVRLILGLGGHNGPRGPPPARVAPGRATSPAGPEGSAPGPTILVGAHRSVPIKVYIT